jgi:cytochrome c
MDKYLIRAAMVGLLAAAGNAQAAIDDRTASGLMGKAQCTACHNVQQRLVGPSFKQVARKHKDDKGAVAALVKKVREGGTGVYGQIPMPPIPKNKISDTDLGNLVEWILSR